MEAHSLSAEKPFHGALEKFMEMTGKLLAGETQAMHLGSLESLIETDGREMLRRMLEEHVRLRGIGNIGEAVEGSDSVVRTHLRARSIKVKSIFGEITIERTIYSAPEHESLAPKEAMLNLPENSYSHGLEGRLALEIAKGSFDEAIAAVESQTGVKIPKRQAEMIARNVAQDFDAFYAERGLKELRQTTRGNAILALTTDAKGVVMRKDDLREATKKRAEKEKKLKKRLSKGEKRNAKRMAQVASVYSIDRHERTAAEIVEGTRSEPAPKPEAKRVWASLEDEPEQVIAQMFDEANRRDPKHKRDWVILVDGQIHQLELIERELTSRKLAATIVLDIIHVIEYVWKAARDFYAEDSKEGEQWVGRYLLMILEGKAKQVAAAIRRSATRQGIKNHEGVDACANYLHNNAANMSYEKYLEWGFPIATGVIEGACRHLVKDRMDLTGARWSLDGAEAVLRLRSIHASGDWKEYFEFHEGRDYERNHRSRYARPERLERPNLQVVK